MQGGGGFGPPPGPPPGGFGAPPGPPPGGGFGPPPGPPPGGGFGPPAGAPGGGFGPPPGGGMGGPMPGSGGPQTDVMAFVSIGLGVISILLGCCCAFFNIPFALGAIGVGAWSITRQNANPMLTGKQLAYVGIGLGAAGFVVMIIRVVLSIAGVALGGLENLPGQH